VAMEWPRKSRPAQQADQASGPQQSMIDVRELMATLSDAELLQQMPISMGSPSICHKPFSNIADAIHIHRNLALLLQGLAHPGAAASCFPSSPLPLAVDDGGHCAKRSASAEERRGLTAYAAGSGSVQRRRRTRFRLRHRMAH
jgi:hypothetical protein